MKSISTQLREARIEAKLTQQELANRSQITVDTINRIENGRKAYTYVHTLQQIQKALNIKFSI